MPSSTNMRFTISFFLLPSAHTVPSPGASSIVPQGSSIPREARKVATPSKRGLPSMCAK
ncbi:hypothetical protein D3C74_422560 [compost metagenome]